VNPTASAEVIYVTASTRYEPIPLLVEAGMAIVAVLFVAACVLPSLRWWLTRTPYTSIVLFFATGYLIVEAATAWLLENWDAARFHLDLHPDDIRWFAPARYVFLTAVALFVVAQIRTLWRRAG